VHLRVDLPDGRYALVLEGGDEGANGELSYVGVAQGLDQSPEGPKANLASERQAPNHYPRLLKLFHYVLL
jgi:hypothetical protein